MPIRRQRQKTIQQTMRWYSDKVHGKHRGEGMGTPTVNLAVPDGFAYPHGIYAGLIISGSNQKQTHLAAFHYGPIPTFKETDISLDAYILEGIIEIPPSLIGFELIQYLRPIKQFRSKKDLAEQILKDAAETQKVFRPTAQAK